MSDFRIGVCFSGGGARGVAHIGVLVALQEAGIPIAALAGTSAGAIVGALHAAGVSTQDMHELARQSSMFKIYRMGIPRMGLTRLDYLRDRLEKLIPEDDFGALQIPLYVGMTNLCSGQLVIRSQGPLHQVIEAACSVPLVFKPVEIDGDYYADGGLLNNMPVEPLLTKTDFVIGVNVMPQVAVDPKELNSWMGIASRCFDLSIHANTRVAAAKCDYLIEPKGIHKYGIWQFTRNEEMYQIGYESAKAVIPDLKRRIGLLQRVMENETQ